MWGLAPLTPMFKGQMYFLSYPPTLLPLFPAFSPYPHPQPLREIKEPTNSKQYIHEDWMERMPC